MSIQELKRINEKGLVFNIQQFSIHDGPGIRTTVFMNGCPLRCPWCCNPESQNLSPRIYTRDIKCIGCGACVKACPSKAIGMSLEKGRVIDWSKCAQCLKCVDACVANAIITSGEYLTIEDIMKIVKKDTLFYKNSGGGITISGGEPLCQSAFVAKLLKECKEEGISTAIETSGYVLWEEMHEVIKFTDLALIDVKHMNSDEHKRVTGVENKIILENLINTSKLVEVWIRIPVITNFNDSEENINEVAAMAKELGIKKITLLPYHEGGKSKCEQLGLNYTMSNAVTPTNEKLATLVKICESHGVTAIIGS